MHLRTTNPIESTFATVRLRTKVTRGAGSRTAALLLTTTPTPDPALQVRLDSIEGLTHDPAPALMDTSRRTCCFCVSRRPHGE